MANHITKIIWTFLFSFLLLFQIYGNNNWDEFMNINVEDGLPHYTINDLLQDHKGYIWIATNDGLVKYNSYDYKVFKYKPNCNSGISGQQIHKLFEDSKNQLWVGTNKSLNLFNKSTEEVTSFYFYNENENFTEKVPVTDICEYNDSTFLIGTDGGGLYLFNPRNNSYVQYKEIDNFKSYGNYLRISDIVIDKNREIWVASLNQGLLKFNILSKTITKKNTNALNISEIRSMIPFGENKLLIGSYGDGLWEYNTKSDTITKCKWYHKSLKNNINRIYTIKYISQKNALYIGTDGGGLIKYHLTEKKMTQLIYQGYNPYSVSNNVIKTILVDNENNLWLGHYRGGISFAACSKPFYNLRYNPALSNTLSNNMVNCIIKDNNENILIGTDGGGLNILKEDGTIVNELTNDNQTIKQFNSQSILSLYKDHLNNIWVGTYLNGIYVILNKSGNTIHFKKNHQLSNNDIRCFYEDREGNIWIGTNGGGINIYHPKEDSMSYIFRNEFDIKSSISLNWIRCIFGDSYGFIWIGTAYGLNKYDPINHTFTKYYFNAEDKNSISNDFIYSVFEDSNKEIWIGTSCGLNKYNRTKDNFRSYYTQNGLPNNIIYNITEDNSKNLWISTNKGISNFNIKDSSFYNYDISDGLLSESFINGAMYKSNDNIIYLGSIKGLTYFKPTEIKKSTAKGSLILTDFKIFNKSIPIGKQNNRVILKKHISETESIKLSSKENFIAFEFTFLNYSNSGKIKYEYMLENFDKEWVQTEKKQRKAIYTNLKPGKYVFKVRTSNSPVTHEKAIALTIAPSFIQSIWFKILATLVVIALVYYWDKIRILKIERQKVMLEKKMLKNKLRYEKEQINLVNKNLQFEMESKNAQLTSSALLISHKNDIMKEVKNKLIYFANNSKSNDLDMELKNIITSINKEFKVEEDWNRFEEHFNQIHKGFFYKLKNEYCELSSTYLKLSAYLKMNLTSKEIASLMNISVRGVEKARSRLRQKLKIPNGERLTTFIDNL